jgi:hypothetical protein
LPAQSPLYDPMFKRINDAVGRPAASSLALFMVPGMGHCQGGPGTDVFDKVAALDKWVESRTRGASAASSEVSSSRASSMVWLPRHRTSTSLAQSCTAAAFADEMAAPQTRCRPLPASHTRSASIDNRGLPTLILNEGGSD